MLIRLCVDIFQDNYPDLLHSAKVVPTTWFFSMCYQVTSTVLDDHTRAKFEFISEYEVAQKLHPFVSPQDLPPHLGGWSDTYSTVVDIEFKME